MNRSGLLASVVLLLAVGSGVAFWLTRERQEKKALPSRLDPADRKRETETPTSEAFQPLTPVVEPIAFTYTADGVQHTVTMKECENLRHRLSMYADLDYAEPAGDYEVFEFVFSSYELRDAGIAVTKDEIHADYARLFEATEFEKKLKSYLEMNNVSREDFDFIVRGRIAARKLISILGSSGMASDKETYDEIGGFGTQHNLAYVFFEAAPFRAGFPNLPPATVNQNAFELCHAETQKVKDEIVALNNAMCQPAIDSIVKEENDLAEKEIAAKADITGAESESIRARHREAATARSTLCKLDNGGKAFDAYTHEKKLDVKETGWFSLPSPLKPQLPPGANFFQSHALATRLLKGRFGGVYDDAPTGCYIAKKIDDRQVEASPTVAEIIRGRYRWSHRHGFKRELCLRFPALMLKYQCTPVTLGSSPNPIPGGPAKSATKKPSDANLPQGVPNQGEDPDPQSDEGKSRAGAAPPSSDSGKEPK